MSISSPTVTRTVTRYAAAAGLVGIASVVRWQIPSIFEGTPYLAFYPAVVAAAAYGGLGAGLLATILTAFLVGIVFAPAGSQLSLNNHIQLARTGVFLIGGGTMSAVAGMMRSSHRREETQREELRHSEQRFNSLLIEGAKDYAIVALDRDGQVSTWNTGAQRLLGFAAEQIVGRHFSRFYLPGDISGNKPQLDLEKARVDGQFFEEARRLRRDGSEFWAGVTITALRDDGVVRGFALITRDLSERKAAEDSVRQSEQRLRLLVEVVKEYAIMMLDANGNVVTWNTGAQRIKGYTPEQIIGRSFDCFYTPEDIAAGKPQTELAIASQTGQYVEENWRVRQDGSRFWANVTMTAIRDSEGKLHGFAKITRDLTEKRQAEQKIQQAMEELARSNAELQQFAYVASHDLQEPLRAIAGCVQLLQQRYHGKLEGRADEFISHAVDGCSRMKMLINDLLEYSRVGTRVTALREIDCNEVLKNALRNLQSAIADKNARISSDPLPCLMGDETRLMQLLQNLVGNALKFISSERTPEVHVSAKQVESGWQFSVRDNGIGIEPQYRERIFGVFQRLHTRAEYPGTGIGLAICKRIVERHGGRIWVESKPGQGTTFNFTIAEGIS